MIESEKELLTFDNLWLNNNISIHFLAHLLKIEFPSSEF